KDVVDIENIVAIFIVEAVIFDALAGLCKNSAGVPRGFVLEAGVADSVRGREVNSQSLEGLGSSSALDLGLGTSGATYADEATFWICSSERRLRVNFGPQLRWSPDLFELGNRTLGGWYGSSGRLCVSKGRVNQSVGRRRRVVESLAVRGH